MTAVPSFFHDYQRMVEAELARLLPADGDPVSEAMAYTVAPAKRVRPVLTLLSTELGGGARSTAVPAAAARAAHRHQLSAVGPVQPDGSVPNPESRSPHPSRNRRSEGQDSTIQFESRVRAPHCRHQPWQMIDRLRSLGYVR
jgi:hypothetical protein